MRYLERQESARQRTRLLQLQFAALASLALLVAFVLALFVGYILTFAESVLLWMIDLIAKMPAASDLWGGAAVHAVLLVPLILHLSRGDPQQPLRDLREKLDAAADVDERDPAFRKLTNVVEEMALASGIPSPRVRLWARHRAINSVTLGFGPADSALYVTRTAVEGLARAELQALVAYSMGQILNGDVALNMRLASYSHWFMVGPRCAFWLMRVPAVHTGKARFAVSRFLFWLFIGALGGLMLLAACSPMILASRFLQARVGRERQRLADASVLQFTRDRDAFEGLLLTVWASDVHERRPVGVPELVGSFAHCCFVAPGGRHWLSPQETPLERLRTLDPQRFRHGIEAKELDRKAADVRRRVEAAEQQRVRPAVQPVLHMLQPLLPIVAAVSPPVTIPVRPPRLDLRPPLAEILAILLDRHPEVRTRQLQAIQSRLEEASFDRATDACVPLGALAPAERTRALDQRLPSLRDLPAQARAGFRECVVLLGSADDSVDVFEFALTRAVLRFIDALDEPRAPHGSLGLMDVRDDVVLLFSVLASFSAREKAHLAFDAGMRAMNMQPSPTLQRVTAWAGPLDLALSRLDQLSPIAKSLLLDGMATTAAHDGTATLAERELMRAVAASLSCPQVRQSSPDVAPTGRRPTRRSTPA